MELPRELIANAMLRGREFSWHLAEFPHVLTKAEELGYACLGGQFQFRTPDATCEMYWLNADSEERKPGEAWPEFVMRSCSEVKERFDALSKTDFTAEAQRWPAVQALSGPSATPLEHLCFVAYFVSPEPANA